MNQEIFQGPLRRARASCRRSRLSRDPENAFEAAFITATASEA